MKTMGVALERSAPRMTSASMDPSQGRDLHIEQHEREVMLPRQIHGLVGRGRRENLAIRAPQCRLERGQGRLVSIDDQAFHPLGSFSHCAFTVSCRQFCEV